jgi:hypothetical protein
MPAKTSYELVRFALHSNVVKPVDYASITHITTTADRAGALT